MASFCVTAELLLTTTDKAGVSLRLAFNTKTGTAKVEISGNVQKVMWTKEQLAWALRALRYVFSERVLFSYLPCCRSLNPLS